METVSVRSGRHVNALISLFLLGVAGSAAAAGDMLQPGEVQETGKSTNPANDSGLFVGGGLGFGQGKSTDGGSPGTAYFLNFEPGYQFNTGSWSRFELSGQLLTGSVSYRAPDERGGKVTMPIKLGAILKAGYGYSLGNKLFGIARIGFGVAQADWKGEVDDLKVKSADTLSGTTALFAYDVVAPMTSSLDVVGGFTWMHMWFDLDKVKYQGEEYDAEDYSSIQVNVPQLTIGLRARL